MVRAHGQGGNYVSGADHVPIPMDDGSPRKAHAPWCQRCKRKVPLTEGLCEKCTRAVELQKARGIEPPPRGPKPRRRRAKDTDYSSDVEADLDRLRALQTRDRRPRLTQKTGQPPQVSGGRSTLDDDLAELERTDPAVAAAAASYDDMVQRVTRPEQFARPPADLSKVIEAVNEDVRTLAAHTLPNSSWADVDAQIDLATRVLRSTADATDPVVQRLRSSVLTTIDALHLLTGGTQ